MTGGGVDVRREIALGCRVLAHRGAVEDILGHISVRVDVASMFVRCRGPEEAGLRFTTTGDIRRVDAHTGRIVGDASGSWSTPSELPIHTSVLAARSDVDCVVHAHPPEVVIASVAGIDLLPIFGAYNIPAMRMAADGIPVHRRSVLIRNDQLATEMVTSLGDAPALVLAGHGVVTVGRTVAEAVLRALHVQTLARMTLGVVNAQASPRSIPVEDMAELPDLGAGFNEDTLWRHHLAALDADGWGLEGDAAGRANTSEQGT